MQERAAGKARFAATGGRVDLSAYTSGQPEQAAMGWPAQSGAFRGSGAAAGGAAGGAMAAARGAQDEQAPHESPRVLPEAGSAPMPSAGMLLLGLTGSRAETRTV